MHRRQMLRAMGASAALAGLSPARVAALLANGAPRHPARVFFTREQREAVDAIADLIIPETDTPGALDAGVTNFIEIVVGEWYEDDDRAAFVRGLAAIDARATAEAGMRFPECDFETRTAILSAFESEGDAARAAAEAAGEDAEQPFFHRVRSLVLHGYYTSEVGITEELVWRRRPGRFEGCVDVEMVTRPAPGGARG